MSGFFVVVFFLNQEKAKSGEQGRERERQKKKNHKKALKTVQKDPNKGQDRGKLNARNKAQRKHTIRKPASTTPESAKHGLYSLARPLINARAHTHTHT